MKRISPIALLGFAFATFTTMSCLCSNLLPGKQLVISPDELSNTQIGIPYEETISISQNGSPAMYFEISEGALPPGLELVYVEAQDTAKITGTPTEAGTFTFTIGVQCFGTNQSGEWGEKQFTINVAGSALDEVLLFDPDQLPEAQVSVPYDAMISISGNISPTWDFQITAGQLPPGLELFFVEAHDTASISGTPTEPGTYSFTISVQCFGTNEAGQVGEKEYSIIVN